VLQVAIAATAAAVAAVVVLVALPSAHGPSQASATAAEMLASMNTASLRDTRTVRLTYTLGHRAVDGDSSWTGGPGTTKNTATLSASGDIRYSTIHVPAWKAMATTQVRTYDEQSHEARWINGPPPVGKIKELTIFRPAWDLEASGTSDTWLSRFSGWVRSCLEETDPHTPVTRTTYLGRPAWHAVLLESLAHPARTVEWSVTVDRETGLVLRTDSRTLETPPAQVPTVDEFRVTRFEVNPALPRDWDTVPEAGKERIGIIDDATRFGTPEETARRSAPTPVLIPSRVPRGYRLSDVATVGHPGIGGSSAGKARLVYLSRHNPRKYLQQRIGIDPAIQHVAIRYRRGFTTFEITVLPPRGASGKRAPLGLAGADLVTLTGGYLAGEKARVGVAPSLGLPPTLVAVKDGYRITISGDLTQQELITVADSLEARGK
jgi:hypothetical protein